MKTYRWGILGTGNIARKFARSLQLLSNAELYSVGSRDKVRAELFARENGFARSYGSYQEFAADPDLDVAYISSPHSFHFEHTLLLLREGKHVICEKPMSLNAEEVRVMAEEATSKKLFLMEALWPPFQESYLKAQEILDSGRLGKILHMRGKFAFSSPYDPMRRTYNIDLGGGSLLDIGIYPVMDILRYMGHPDVTEAFSVMAPTGADESTSMIFRFNDGRLAEACSSFGYPGGISTEFNCENGNIFLSRGRDTVQRLVVEYADAETIEMRFTPPAQGFQFEAMEVMHCLDKGLNQSSVVPLSFSIELAEILDEIRKKTGVVYPSRDKQGDS